MLIKKNNGVADQKNTFADQNNNSADHFTNSLFIYRTNFFSGAFQRLKTNHNFEELPKPRMIKTHLAPPFIPEQIWDVKPKIIHVSRNIKDVALSGYHMLASFIGIPLELDQYLDTFLNDGVIYCPFVAHTELCWDLEEQGYPNILYLNYDEMMVDVEATIKKIQKFLGMSYSDEQLKLLKDHLSFNNMKSRLNLYPLY